MSGRDDPSAGAWLRPYRSVLAELAQLSGVPDPVFETYYGVTLRAVAARVRNQPAPGTAAPRLAVVLEHARNALRRRRDVRLPRGAAPHEALAQADLWTYAAFAAVVVRALAAVEEETVSPAPPVAVVPVAGLVWLASDPTVFEHWLAAVAGADAAAEALGDLVRACLDAAASARAPDGV